MNEQERAGWLARAVDKLIQRREAERPPEDPNSQDLDALMWIARARLDLAESAAHDGARHEGSVWRKVRQRLENRTVDTPGAEVPPLFQRTSDDAAALFSEPEFHELGDIAAVRQRMSAQMRSFAEEHRREVWERIQSRIARANTRKGPLSFFRTAGAGGRANTEPVLDAFATGQTLWQSGGSHTDELVALARERRALGPMNERSLRRSGVWSAVAGTVCDVCRAAVHLPSRSKVGWQRLAAGAATIALIIAAVGPIPTTGLAGHPFARFIETVGNHVGVSESGPPPVDMGSPTVLEGAPVTATEASDLLRLAVSEPVYMPAGYHLRASLYYPVGVTGDGGTFLLSYTSEDVAILLFQEARTASRLGISSGEARDITLVDGTPATSFSGGWIPGSSGFAWTDGGGQSLTFDRNGIRTIIQFIGDEAAVPDLTAIANGLR